MQIYTIDNSNGKLLMECFPIIRPSSESLTVGTEIQIMTKSELVGYATIVSGIETKWKHISENISYLYMGKPSPYVKKVLSTMFGFSLDNPVTSEFPVFFGFAKWTERHLPVQSEMFQNFFDKIKETHTKTEETMTQATFF